MFTARDFNEILPCLFLGSVFAVSSLDTLEELEVTHILTMGNDMSPKFPEKFEYKVWKLEDDIDADVKQYFEDGIQFIDEALNSGGTVFVHCAAGISRSSSMVWAYLMKSNGWKFKKALNFVVSKRKFACPNSGFQQQLLEFEKEIDFSEVY